MAKALVTARALVQARERAGLSQAAMAEALGEEAERIARWEAGDESPPFGHAEKWAKVTRIPFGYLYLAELPEEEPLPLPDLRTLADQAPGSFSPDFRELVREVYQKYEWYRDYLRRVEARAPPFVGRFGLDSDPKDVAADIRRELALPEPGGKHGKQKHLAVARDCCERAGITVLVRGFPGYDTGRGVSVDEFRGFAIVDDLAPVVVVNHQDMEAAQLFTLGHEVAHIWCAQSGVSRPALDERKPTGRQVERWCNAVSAELWVPEAQLAAVWTSNQPLEAVARKLAAHFYVSAAVVARRAADLGYVGWDAYIAFLQQEKAAWQKLKDQQKDQPGGPGRVQTLDIHNGSKLTQAVVASALEGDMTLREGARMLTARPKTLFKYYQTNLPVAS